jgi:hypothetical protein
MKQIQFNAGRRYDQVRYPYLTINWRQNYQGYGIQRPYVFRKDIYTWLGCWFRAWEYHVIRLYPMFRKFLPTFLALLTASSCQHLWRFILVLTLSVLNKGYCNIENILEKFDAVATFSSVEYSGLGRFGDMLNPWGDISNLSCLYRPIILSTSLTVHTGIDVVRPK